MNVARSACGFWTARRLSATAARLQVEQPFDLLRIDGRSCKLFRHNDLRDQVERMEGFLPWNGNTDNMIDRFDGRALLDFYRRVQLHIAWLDVENPIFAANSFSPAGHCIP